MNDFNVKFKPILVFSLVEVVDQDLITGGGASVNYISIWWQAVISHPGGNTLRAHIFTSSGTFCSN